MSVEDEVGLLAGRLSGLSATLTGISEMLDWHLGEDSSGANSFGSHTQGTFSAIVVGNVVDYDSGNGFFVDFKQNTSRLFIGDSTGNKLTWDGTTLSVTGTLTATLGTIGGWTIGATTLTGSGSNAIVLTSGGTGSMRSGQTAYDTGTGWYIEAGATPRFSIGNSAGDKLLWDGSTMTITGRLNFGTGDYIDNDIIHFEVPDSETSAIEVKTSGWGAGTPYAEIQGRSGSTVGSLVAIGYGTSSRKSQLAIRGGNTDAATQATMYAITGAGLLTGINATADGALSLLSATAEIATMATANRAFSLHGRLYLGSGSASQSTRYLVDDGTRSEFFGGNLRIAAPAGLVIPTKAGTPGDADFTDDVDGQIALDTTNNLLYFRSTTWQAIAGGVTGLGAVGGQIDIGDSASNGSNTTASRSDHQHAFPAPSAGYPVDVETTEADGTATTPARSDHQHKLGSVYGSAGYPVDVDSSEADGSAATLARSDHKHKLGILTTKGDVLTYSTLPARLAVGANGKHLAADSSQTEGIAWVAAQQASNDFLTISGGTIVMSALPSGGNLLIVDTEGAAGTDDLDTISISSGWPTGGYVTVVAASSSRTVVVKDGTGNLFLAGDFSLTHEEDTITLVYNGNINKWLEVARSDNAV